MLRGRLLILIANGLKNIHVLYDEPAGNHRRDHEKSVGDRKMKYDRAEAVRYMGAKKR